MVDQGEFGFHGLERQLQSLRSFPYGSLGVGDVALEHWKFPRDFIAPVVNHHRPLATIQRLGPQHSEAAATIALADRLSHALLLGSSGNDVLYPVDELTEFLSLPADIVGTIATRRPTRLAT